MLEQLGPDDPRSLGPYLLIGRLGGGGMGQVYLGRSPGARLVAVKVIHPELLRDPEFRARFGREVAAARRVSGMFTAQMVDADADGSPPWLATAFVRGPSLADAVADRGPLPAAALLDLAVGLAEGLSRIHAADVVHRDLKPSNVLLSEYGPLLIDFGIARAAEVSAITRTGLVVGSPGFMSPEQAEGRQAGPATDVFSLGAVLVYAAKGDGPFGSGSVASLLYKVVHSEPDLGGVPSEVADLVARCLAKDPGDRPGTAEILALVGRSRQAGARLENWLPHPSYQQRIQAAIQALEAATTPATPATISREPGPVPAAPTGAGPATASAISPSAPATPALAAGQAPGGPPPYQSRQSLPGAGHPARPAPDPLNISAMVVAALLAVVAGLIGFRAGPIGWADGYFDGFSRAASAATALMAVITLLPLRNRLIAAGLLQGICWASAFKLAWDIGIGTLGGQYGNSYLALTAVGQTLPDVLLLVAAIMLLSASRRSSRLRSTMSKSGKILFASVLLSQVAILVGILSAFLMNAPAYYLPSYAYVGYTAQLLVSVAVTRRAMRFDSQALGGGIVTGYVSMLIPDMLFLNRFVVGWDTTLIASALALTAAVGGAVRMARHPADPISPRSLDFLPPR